MTLYELTDNYLALLNLAEWDEVEPEAIKDTLDAVEGELESKAEGYATVINKLKLDSQMLDNEIKRLSERKKTIDGNIDRMNQTLQEVMQATGKTKFKTMLYSFGIQKNPPSVSIPDDSAVPEEFRIPQPDKIDRKAALKYIKENGNQSWGEIKQTERLVIR